VVRRLAEPGRHSDPVVPEVEADLSAILLRLDSLNLSHPAAYVSMALDHLRSGQPQSGLAGERLDERDRP
jgi:hypothetical protein